MMTNTKHTVLVILLALLILAPACAAIGDDEDAAPFEVRITPSEVADSAPDQRVVLLVTVEDTGEGRGTGEAVNLAVAAEGAEVTVEPSGGVEPGVVGEITVIPGEDLARAFTGEPVQVALQPEPVTTVNVEIEGEREGLTEAITVSIGVGPADEFPLDAAEEVRDIFVPWLAENHPELEITPDTEWTATPTKPHWLVVSHYLFFSERWEMGVRWHIMIPPHNWAEIYLRERFVDVDPSLGFKVDSVTEDPTGIYQVEVVEPVWR